MRLPFLHMLLLFSHQGMSNSATPWTVAQQASVTHYLLEFSQVHVCWIGDAIQPSHPLLPSSPSAFNLSQHQGVFQWVSHSHQVAKYWSFSFTSVLPKRIQGWFPLRLTGLILLSKGLSRFSSTTVWKHQFYHRRDEKCVKAKKKKKDYNENEKSPEGSARAQGWRIGRWELEKIF